MKKDKKYFKKLEEYSISFLQGILSNEHINLSNPEQNVDWAIKHSEGLMNEIKRMEDYEGLKYPKYYKNKKSIE